MSAASKPGELGELVARVTTLEQRANDQEGRLRVVERNTPSPEEQRDREQRIRALEQSKWQVAGAIGALAFLGSIVGSLLKALVN